MMQFAQPLGLLALLSIPVIILLHVLRPRRQTMTVSSTSLWTEALRERQRGLGLQKLFRNLSLLLLLLAAVAASLALAEPRWLTQASEQRDVILLIDVSASMQARSGQGTRLDEAKAAAQKIIDALPAQARALVITSANKAILRSGFETNSQVLSKTLAQITATDEAGKPEQALALAASLLRSRDEGKIVFITDAAFDMKSTINDEFVDYQLVGQGAGKGDGKDAKNLAITRFDFRSERGSEDRFQVLLTVRNYTDAPVTVPTSVTLERRELFAREITVSAQSARTIVLPFEGKALGRATARIDIDDDLSSDNSAYAVANIADRTHILLFSPGNFYLESVLDALPNVEVTLADENQLANIEREARRYNVVIFDRLQPPALIEGNFLLLGTIAPNLGFQAAESVAKPGIQGVGNSALMQGIDLTGVRIDETLRIPNQTNATGTQRLFWSAEAELALAILDDRKRMVVVGFDINRSNFALQAAFPLFITRTLNWLHPQGLDGPQTQITAGETYTIQVGAAQKELIMRTPNGDGLIYELDNGALTYENTSTTGIYRYSVDNVVRYFAVNLTDADESNISARAAGAVDTRTTTVADGGHAQLGDDVIDSAGAQAIKALWPQLTMVLLILLVIEWLLWCTARRHA